MTARFARVPLFTVIAVALAVLLALVVVVPRVSGAEPQTITFSDSIDPANLTTVPAPGHDGTFPARGDVLSAQGTVFATGDESATPTGSVYIAAVGTADPQNFATAANHLYAQAFIELWGQGSLAVTGTINFMGTPTYLAIIGGTGVYAGASGQCTLVAGDIDNWSCDIQ